MQGIIFFICVSTIFITIHVLVLNHMISSINSNYLQTLMETQKSKWKLVQKEQARVLTRESTVVRLVPLTSHNASSATTPEVSRTTLTTVDNDITYRSGTKNTNDEYEAFKEISRTKTTNQTANSEIPNKSYEIPLYTLSERDKKSVIEEKDKATSSKDMFRLKADTSALHCRQTVVDNLHIPVNETLVKKISRSCPKYFNISSDISALFERDFKEENMFNLSCVTTSPQFLNKSKPLVALASFPGAGNSWVRQILEAVTGIYTGSIYADTMASFTGSKRCPTNGQVFIVKTHKSGISSTRPHCPKKLNYEKAVFILRNPYDAIMAEFNRVHGGKLGVAKEEEYAKDKWPRTVKQMSDRWRTVVVFWLTKFKNPVYTLVYDQLKTNIAIETYKVMQFINFPVTLHSLYCLNEKYLRAAKPAWLTKENLYSRDLKELVNANIARVADALRPLPDIQKVLKRYAIEI